MPLDGNPKDFETVTKTDEVADTLMRAAQVIRDRGHYKGGYCDPASNGEGAVCVLGAIRVAHGGHIRIPEADLTDGARALTKHLRVQWPHEWNDAPERTAAQVIDALEGAARARHLLSQS